MSWTEAHSNALPVAAKNGFVADGGALAISSSPQEQGQSAARLTVALLQGKSPQDLPVKEGQAFVVAMHADKLENRGYRLPKVYEAAARAAGAYY
ncbi:MAG: ABC transporter substrate-binding protein [Comamonadaceae bacterium]|nr:MAG: ABC transporter substrate-binding protein [Comamonadaceae bacterium]